MKVFKFGGASANTLERIRNIADIIRSYADQKILIVISAMGKTTNALEKVVESYYAGDREQAGALFGVIKRNHLDTAKYLLTRNYLVAEEILNKFFIEVDWLLQEKPSRDFDYYYDQIVCVGELFSTCIISSYLNEVGVDNVWLDVRDILRTDDNFRDAGIDWQAAERNIKNQVLPVFSTADRIITQGFIGSTDENESTTLGREGSDYSAAVFANVLEAECLTIWKDVEGVMNADPKQFPSAEFIGELNYDEVIEMAYYGAQVIHPKTIKPLQNKNLPLYVKCFLDPKLPGTLIHAKSTKKLPPIIVLKTDQVLMHLHSKDFSFVGESLTASLYTLFANLKIRPNLIQSGAVSLKVCVDDRAEKTEKLALSASEFFDVRTEKNLTLLTIRHYAPESLSILTQDKIIVLKQQSPQTIQVLMK
ncbi:MAG TPA: aspartate kinase [Puia sp.]|nr:aspartate kinase [Puia sp.]